MRKRSEVPLLVFLFCFAILAEHADAKVYRVGPAEVHKRLSQVADLLEPGDFVEVTGDIIDTVMLSKHGRHDRPITIRGITRIEGNRIVRPKITPTSENWIMACSGHWNVLEGLEFDGLGRDGRPETAGLCHGCDNLTIRNCRFRRCAGKAIQGADAGSLLLEFCEFDSNGSEVKRHSVDLFSENPSCVATVQYCYFHDGTGGVLLKTRCPRNVIRYNWFEAPFYSALAVLGQEWMQNAQEKSQDSPLFPMHSDIIGNVFFQGWTPGSRYSVISLGGENDMCPGTEGDINFAHNLFIITRDAGGSVVPLLVHGNVDHVKAYNNAFLELGTKGCQLYLRGSTWDTPRTKEFVRRRGSGDPVLEGANNWVSLKTTCVPEAFLNTLRGVNPKFLDLLNSDFRPRKDSPLAGAAMFPLPKGQIIDLVPEFEPQRGIPADLKPKTRRKAVPPSIGPFEVEE